eukprot:CAMPEP_0183740314 /NCGR_PEP_ID=MMETSP0737-20130205/59268_1 /TAXON_ID=385413 /ORGANISM="Thalassiosira miniscula, Strain CCMP1093" /LENGTH=184 /DNA_ID=CAMNT_0025975333 /DNA_START=1088 /DNA_END=1638 /DNA_ORIENTATION=-
MFLTQSPILHPFCASLMAAEICLRPMFVTNTSYARSFGTSFMTAGFFIRAAMLKTDSSFHPRPFRTTLVAAPFVHRPMFHADFAIMCAVHASFMIAKVRCSSMTPTKSSFFGLIVASFDFATFDFGTMSSANSTIHGSICTSLVAAGFASAFFSAVSPFLFVDHCADLCASRFAPPLAKLIMSA